MLAGYKSQPAVSSTKELCQLTTEIAETATTRGIMPYEIHIQRDDGEAIAMDEWKNAIEATEGVRLAVDDIKVKNPRTGEAVSIARNPWDADLYSSESCEWLPCIRFSGGRASFAARDGFMDEGSSCRKTIRVLSITLRAQLVGDEGEVYT